MTNAKNGDKMQGFRSIQAAGVSFRPGGNPKTTLTDTWSGLFHTCRLTSPAEVAVAGRQIGRAVAAIFTLAFLAGVAEALDRAGLGQGDALFGRRTTANQQHHNRQLQAGSHF